MGSTSVFIDCPICEYPFAEDYSSTSGENYKACDLCGYWYDTSNIRQDYFSSIKEMESYARNLKLQNKIPTKKIIIETKKISEVINKYKEFFKKGALYLNIRIKNSLRENKKEIIKGIF